jgi:hypothetical protein
MRTDFGIVQSDFFNEFTAQCRHVVFALIKSTARKCPASASRKFKAD